MPGEPRLEHGVTVRGVVVEDDMDVEPSRNAAFGSCGGSAEKFLLSMAGHAIMEDLSRGYIKGSE